MNWFVLFCALFLVVNGYNLSKNYTNCALVNYESGVKVHWTIENTTIHIGIEADLNGYISVGLSQDGSMDGGSVGFADGWVVIIKLYFFYLYVRFLIRAKVK